MAGQQIRGDYDQLEGISKTLNEHSEAISTVFQDFQQKYEVLAGGEWLGDAAEKFFGEHESSVKPSLQKLIQALSEAGRTIDGMSKRIKQAEDEASGCINNAIRM